MRAMNETQRFVTAAIILTLTVLFTTAAQARREPKPLVGFPVGPQMNEIVLKRFIIDPPTIENLGFRWYIEGDSNRNASVTVEFRRKGQSQWKKALPMLRVHHEIVNQVYGPYRTGNLFASSVLFLEPATTYQVRFTMSDPDGGAPAEPRIVSTTTRAERQASRLQRLGRQERGEPRAVRRTFLQFCKGSPTNAERGSPRMWITTSHKMNFHPDKEN